MPAPARTQAKARAAPAGGLRAHTPEKSHRSLPQALTAASRKSSPQFPKTVTGRSRTSSPTHPANAHRPFPGKAHRGFPQGLTGSSREGSPDAPESAHLTAPGKAHLPLPKSLTFVPFRMEQVRNARVCAPEHGAGTGDMRRTTRMPSTATNAATRGAHSFQQVAKRASYRSAYRRAKSRTICIPNYNRCVRSRPCITDIAHSAATAHDTVGGSSTLVVAITVAASS